MPLTQAMCTSFKVELLTGGHDFGVAGNTFNLALFRQRTLIAGNFGATTTNYSEMGADETTGTNYVAGGSPLTNITPTSSGTTAYTDFPDLVFSNVTLTTGGCLIYNTNLGNASVGVFDFGTDIVAAAQDITIQFPTGDEFNAVIRIA